jgi:hypothetical protein
MSRERTELPRLRLGTVGFTAPQQTRLQAILSNLQGGLPWRLARFPDADAWCVNGARTVAMPDDSVAVAAACADGRHIRLQTNDSNHPVVFSSPIRAKLPSSCVTFDLESPESTHAMLAKLEGWLRPTAIQFWLGGQIYRQGLDLSCSAFHVSVNGKLQAVISRRNGIGMLPIADPLRLHEAIWARRPEEADEIPRHFVRRGLAEVLWTFAVRTDRDLLPASMRTGLIYWCRAPQVSQRLLSDLHLLVIRELAHVPSSLDQLHQRTAVPVADIARALAALRVVGAISSDKQKAQAASAPAINPGRPAASNARPSALARLRDNAASAAANWADMTAPAPLYARRT